MRLKEWVESFSRKPRASAALFAFAFIESSVFPVPPDVLLVAIGVNEPRKSIGASVICTLGSVTGAFLGYFIGYACFETVGRSMLEMSGLLAGFEEVMARYRENAIAALIIAGFTPIPFMLFSIAAGFNAAVDLATFAAGCLLGRSLRFLPIGGLLYFYGAPVKAFIDKYFERLSLAVATLAGLAALWFVVVNFLA